MAHSLLTCSPLRTPRTTAAISTRKKECIMPEGSRCTPAAPAEPNGFALDHRSLLPSSLDREVLYAEFQPLIKRLIRQYGDSADSRQDLAGEIYYKFCSLHDAFDPGRGVPFRPYMVRQLTAAMYTHARHGWRRQRREISLENNANAFDSIVPPDPSRDWDDRLATDELLQCLPEAISKLPKRQRQVLIWRYYDQRTYEDIAGVLNIEISTARSLLRHAIANLRRGILRHR